MSAKDNAKPGGRLWPFGFWTYLALGIADREGRCVVNPFLLPLVVAIMLGQGTTEKPTVAAIFSQSRAPTFLIECRNLSGGSRVPDAVSWIHAYRIDGVTAPPGVVGGPGAPPALPGQEGVGLVQPGATWRGILALIQPGTDASSVPAAWRQVPNLSNLIATHRLAPGRHTVAVRCVDSWSDDLAFFFLN